MNTTSHLPNILVLQQWLDALTSGQYQQCHEALTITSTTLFGRPIARYCSIGLFFHLNSYIQDNHFDFDRAQQVTGKRALELSYNQMIRFLLNLTPYTPPYTHDLVTELINANDALRLPFPAIAHFIRSHPVFFCLLQDISHTCSSL